MSLELITQDEFIKKYIPAKTKEKKQSFARKKQDCLDMGYTDYLSNRITIKSLLTKGVIKIS